MLKSGERQVGIDLKDIREDHVKRYKFALERVKENSYIYDCGCGIGYGSKMLSQKACKIIAVDIDKETIIYAKKYWSNENIEYKIGDVSKINFGENIFDAIISFEILEHVLNDKIMVKLWSEMLKPKGLLIFSSPDQDNFPWSASDHPFHHRHYSVKDIENLLKNETENLVLKEVYSQDKKGEIIKGTGKRFNIFVAKKEL